MSTLSLLNIFGIRKEGEVISNLEKRSAKGAKRSARRRKGRREKRMGGTMSPKVPECCERWPPKRELPEKGE